MSPRLLVLRLAPGAHLVQWVDGDGSPVDDLLVVDRDRAAPGWRAVADVVTTAAGVAALRGAANRAARAVRA